MKSQTLLLLCAVAALCMFSCKASDTSEDSQAEVNPFSETYTLSKGELDESLGVSPNDLTSLFGGAKSRICYRCTSPCANAMCCLGPHPQCCVLGIRCMCCRQ